MKKKYPGRRTFQQWKLLTYQERNAWVTQAKCDLLGLWKTCRKRRCRRDRTCRGYQFDCFWQHRAQLQPAAVRTADTRCAHLDALLNRR
jgi:hypothetical protein